MRSKISIEVHGNHLPDATIRDLDHKGTDIRSVSCRISNFKTGGIDSKFLIVNEDDAIQKHHGRGQFYEPDELKIIARHVKPGMVMADIGTNVGNHTIFALQHLKVRHVYAFEPNPDAYNILYTNIGLNNLGRRFTHFPVGLSDSNFMASLARRPNNLGGTRLIQEPSEEMIQVSKGDVFLSGLEIDFMKIDVEGLDINVLNGLEQTISSNRPIIFIEIEDRNETAFHEWARVNNYLIADQFRRYERNQNFLITPE